MNWAGIVIIIWYAIALLIYANKHGQPGEDWNFWTALITTIIIFVLFYFAGIFN